MIRRSLAVMVTSTLLALTTLTTPADAALFTVSCRASVARLVGLEPTVANRAGSPCVDDVQNADVAIGISPGAAMTDTSDPGYAYEPSAVAVAGPMCLPVPDARICFQMASSVAHRWFNSSTGGYEWRGKAVIGGLTINDEDAGALVTFGGYVNLGAPGTLRWNVAMPTTSGLVVRALWLDGPGDADIVVAEAAIGSV
jgi:hypothetical protein